MQAKPSPASSEQPAKGDFPLLGSPPGNRSLIDMGIWNHIKGEAIWRLKISFVLEIFMIAELIPA